MKRTFTLLLAALVAVVTYALPLKQAEGPVALKPVRSTSAAIASLSDAKQLHAVDKLQKKEGAQPDRKARAEAWSRRHAFERNILTQNAQRALKSASSSAEGDTIYITPNPSYLVPEYYPETGDWYLGFYDVTENYIVKLDWVNWNPENPFGTYTIEDLDLDYSYIVDYINSAYVYYEACELTFLGEEVSPKLSRLSLDATIDADDGNVYRIVGVAETFYPEDTVEVTISGGTFAYDDWDFVLSVEAEDGNNSVKLSTMAEGLLCSFGIDYVDAENTEIVLDGKPLSILDLNGETSVNETVTDYVVSLSIVGSDTVLYEIQVLCPLPEADTVEVTLPNMVIDDSWYAWFGAIFVDAYNKDLAVSLTINAASGSFSVAEGTLYGSIETAEGQYEVLNGTLLIEEDINGEQTAYLECLASDFNYYRIHMAWIIPEPVRFADVNFETNAKVNAYTNQEMIVIWNENEDYYARLAILDWIPGAEETEITRSNYYDWYTDLYDNAINEYVSIDVADINGTLKQEGDTLRAKVTIISFDSVQYNVNLWYTVPEPKEEITIPTIEDAEFINALSYGQYLVNGITADGQYTVCFNPSSTSEVAGTYEITKNFSAVDMDANYTYVGVRDETSTVEGEYILYAVLTAEVKVTLENNVVTATGWYLCENEVKYNFTLIADYDKEHIEYDEPEIPADVKMTAADYNFTLSTEYFAGYGEVDFYALNPTELDYLMLTFELDALDETTVVPAGTYDINYSYAAPSVTAGDFDGYYLYASFYCYRTDDGYISVDKPLYFLVGGTVTVEAAENGLHIVVDAVNSYDVPVKIDIDYVATAITNVNADGELKTVKFVKDGQLLIQRGNKVYNVLGAEL